MRISKPGLRLLHTLKCDSDAGSRSIVLSLRASNLASGTNSADRDVKAGSPCLSYCVLVLRPGPLYCDLVIVRIDLHEERASFYELAFLDENRCDMSVDSCADGINIAVHLRIVCFLVLTRVPPPCGCHSDEEECSCNGNYLPYSAFVRHRWVGNSIRFCDRLVPGKIDSFRLLYHCC